MKFSLGGVSKNFDSKKSRAEVVNMYPEGDEKGDYKAVRKCEGETLFATLSLGPVRSDPFVNADKIYVVSGSTLYRVNSAGTVETIGVVNGSGRASIMANAVPGDNQICILNGSGDGYIYSAALGLTQITDADFFNSTSGAVLDERFWFSRDNRNEFFGSEQSNGTDYNPLTFGSADESPDDVVAVVSKKSALWVLGEEGVEYFQRFNDIDFPLRAVKGASKEYGIIAKDSIAEINEHFAYLADDRTVRMVVGTELVEISDLDFRLRVRGNGTATMPGFSVVSDAYGFFVDGPVHSVYYLTFPSEGYTWGYDLKTGMTHTRVTEGKSIWQVNGAVKFGTKIICGDAFTGKLWELDQDNRTENSTLIRTKLVSPSVSFPTNVNIAKIELDMEVASTTDPTVTPVMQVYYTKNGGNTWINKGTVSVGEFGEHNIRVVLRQFGRLVRHKDFALRLETTDDIGVQYYGAEITYEAMI